MTAFPDDVLTLLDFWWPQRVAEQGGILSGDDPTQYSSTDPYRLWVIQVVLIIATSRLLHLILYRLRQPRVVSEILGGIILGPSVMWRVPGFQKHIFPGQSIPLLNLSASIGLVLFLFMAGLEIDVRLVRRHFKVSAAVSVAGLVLPLGLGFLLSILLYKQFMEPDVNFGHFALFTAVAIGITAFPVLCRVLNELKLFNSTVGVIVVSAGVGNDIVGWVLLALAVSLANAKTGLTALWILLVASGYTIFCFYPLRWVFRWLAIRTGSLERGQPTPTMMLLSVLLVFSSAFFTDCIGLHAIFGGFLSGLIIPHDNGFSIALVERLEDLITSIFLPIYFTISGLKTDLGLLNTGKAWGVTVLICVVAFFGKFVGCGFAAKSFGLTYREASAVGTLMACKGLLEVVVVNLGRQANIINDVVFAMFIVHALILTVIITPLVSIILPSNTALYFNRKAQNDQLKGLGFSADHVIDIRRATRFTFILDRVEDTSAMLGLMQLIRNAFPPVPLSNSNQGDGNVQRRNSDAGTLRDSIMETSTNVIPSFEIDALRLRHLTDRASDVLRSHDAAAASLIPHDPVLSIFCALGSLFAIPVSAHLSIVPRHDFVATIANHVEGRGSDMIFLPWRSNTADAERANKKPAAGLPITPVDDKSADHFESIFGSKHAGSSQATLTPISPIASGSNVPPLPNSSISQYAQFARDVLMHSPVDVALFVDRRPVKYQPSQEPSTSSTGYHIFLPFFGGRDDRCALRLVVRLCANPLMSATVVNLRQGKNGQMTRKSSIEDIKSEVVLAIQAVPHIRVTTAQPNDETLPADEAEDLKDSEMWRHFSDYSILHQESTQDALSRITFLSRTSSQPLQTALELSKVLTAQFHKRKELLVAVGRTQSGSYEGYRNEIRQISANAAAGGVPSGINNMNSEVTKTMGEIASVFVAEQPRASLLVIRACSRPEPPLGSGVHLVPDSAV